jgi:hypothetical protein
MIVLSDCRGQGSLSSIGRPSGRKIPPEARRLPTVAGALRPAGIRRANRVFTARPLPSEHDEQEISPSTGRELRSRAPQPLRCPAACADSSVCLTTSSECIAAQRNRCPADSAVDMISKYRRAITPMRPTSLILPFSPCPARRSRTACDQLDSRPPKPSSIAARGP